MLRFLFIAWAVFSYGWTNLTCASAHAQKRWKDRADSLWSALEKAGDDSLKAKLLIALTDQYSAIAPDSGIIVGKSALKLARKLNRDDLIADAYYFLGFNYYNKSNYPKSLECLLGSLTLYESLGNETGIANAARKTGNVYRDLDQYTKALDYYSRATGLFEKNKDKLGLSRCYSNIGELYGFLNRHEEALRYHFAALALAQQINYRNGMVITYFRIGSIYIEAKEFQKALSYHLAAVQIVEKYASEITAEQIEEAYGGAAICYLQLAKHTADVAERNRYLETTVGYLTKAIAGAEAMGQRTDLAIYYKALAETRSLQGDPAAAYGYLLDYTALHDSLFSAKNNFVIAGLESERERVLKEKLNQLQNTRKRNERLAFIAGILLLAGIIAMILRNYRKQRALNKSLADEKERSENLLLNILPQEVAEELKINGTTTARYYDDVTVFFTDFVNFTRAGERMTTQKLVAELHTCFKAFDEIITKYNIEKIKTIGDAYLAVSGLPVTDSRHAENVMKATIEIRDFILRRRQELGNDTFEVRIGIHSGPVVAGIVGARKFAYDIWGDTVNTAARMEQKSEAGKINISQSTFDLVKDKYICSYRGEIEAKNKGMMKMYFVEKAVS